MRKDDSPSGPGHTGPSGPGSTAPRVERDDRDRRALAARISDNAGPPSMLAAVPSPAAPPAASPEPPAARRRTGRGRAATAPFIAPATAEGLNTRMRDAVVKFVDGPGDAVSEAEDLLQDVVTALTDALAERQKELRERQAAAGTDTEQLRLALIAYRATVQALLKV